MNPFKKLKLKSKLRNCDYKLAGTVIKQQYYNDNSYTEINRMIDHFMEEPCFERALDLIEYNEMIVFYFTESCTDGLYVRKAELGKTTESAETNEFSEFSDFSDLPGLPSSPEVSDLPVITPTEQASIFPTPPSSRPTNHTAFEEKDVDTHRKENSAHSEQLKTIQESEEWMDQMISRLAKKPKQPAIQIHSSDSVKEFTRPSVPTAAKVYNDEEAEAFDTIEFNAADTIKDTQEFDDTSRAEDNNRSKPLYENGPNIMHETEIIHVTEVTPEPYVFHEPAIILEPEIAREPYVFHEPAIIQEPEIAREPYVFHEPAIIQEPNVTPEPYVFHEPAIIHEPANNHKHDAFDFVASAASNKHLGVEDPADLFGSSPAKAPYIDPPRVKRPRFPNVAATLKIDLHTMMKQLDEYRHELAYHPSNEQQLIHWIASLEKAVDEFSNAIDIIEDAYE